VQSTKKIKSVNSLVIAKIGILSLVILIFSTSCSSNPIQLGAPSATFYVLDLTGSGNVDSQFKRIESELDRSISEGPFGNPFDEGDENYGPETAYFSFIGTNSRYLESFELVDLASVYSLFEKVSVDNRRKENWFKLKEAYQKYVKRVGSAADKAPTQSECVNYFNQELSSLFNSPSTRNDYAERLCEIAVSNLGTLNKVKQYISIQKFNQKASDVFGAIQILDSKVKQFSDEYPRAKVSVILATDGDHSYGKNQPDNLRNRIQESQEICDLAESVAKELNVETLRMKSIKLKMEGLGALDSGVARYPTQLYQFWQCFFDQHDI
jgi:hypothetical protein